MNSIVRNWVATANYDLRTADAMYKAGRYLYVVFMCHLAIEKMLKAILAQRYPEDVPPKIHNLINLAQRTEITLPENLRDFFQRIDNVPHSFEPVPDIRKNLLPLGEILFGTQSFFESHFFFPGFEIFQAQRDVIQRIVDFMGDIRGH